MLVECKIVIACLGMPLLSLKWKSSSQAGPEPAVLIVLAVACPREPDWAWLPKRLPCGTATGVDVC